MSRYRLGFWVHLNTKPYELDRLSLADYELGRAYIDASSEHPRK